MRTRKKEIDAMVEVLSVGHADVDTLASDLWKLVDNFRRDREVYAVAVRMAGGLNLLFGPYESTTLAQRDVDVGTIKGIDSGDRYQILKLISPSKIFEDSTPTLFDSR